MCEGKSQGILILLALLQEVAIHQFQESIVTAVNLTCKAMVEVLVIAPNIPLLSLTSFAETHKS